MRFSNVCDYKGEVMFICKTGRRNIRILKPGDPYEKSFVVPLKKVSNRRPADVEDVDDEEELDEQETPVEDLVTSADDLAERLAAIEAEFIPQ